LPFYATPTKSAIPNEEAIFDLESLLLEMINSGSLEPLAIEGCLFGALIGGRTVYVVFDITTGGPGAIERLCGPILIG
jgi:hypothetical protein